MRGGGEALAGLEGQYGLEGVRAFAESYPRWPETFGDDLDAALSGLRVFIVKAGTGGAMFRSLQAEFLRDAATALDDEALRAAADEYDALSRAWIALGELAAQRDHAGGVPLVAEVATREFRGIEHLERWLAG